MVADGKRHHSVGRARDVARRQHDRTRLRPDRERRLWTRLRLLHDAVATHDGGVGGAVPAQVGQRLEARRAPGGIGCNRTGRARRPRQGAAPRRIGGHGRRTLQRVPRRDRGPLPMRGESDAYVGLAEIGLGAVVRPGDRAAGQQSGRPELPVDHQRVDGLILVGAEVAVHPGEGPRRRGHRAHLRPERELRRRGLDVRDRSDPKLEETDLLRPLVESDRLERERGAQREGRLGLRRGGGRHHRGGDRETRDPDQRARPTVDKRARSRPVRHDVPSPFPEFLPCQTRAAS